MLTIAFAGSRAGLTFGQMKKFIFCCRTLDPTPTEFRFGDEIGADQQAAEAIYEMFGKNCRVIAHPAEKEEFQAYGGWRTETLSVKGHRERKRNIIDASDILIAMPETNTPITRFSMGDIAQSVQYARKRHKLIWIIFPDGCVQREDVRGGTYDPTH